jgi:hypothetical protein
VSCQPEHQDRGRRCGTCGALIDTTTDRGMVWQVFRLPLGLRRRDRLRPACPVSFIPLFDPDQVLRIEARVRAGLTEECLRLVSELNADRRLLDASFDAERGSLLVRTGSGSARLAVADGDTARAVAQMVKLERTSCLAMTDGAGSIRVEVRSQSWRFVISGIPAAAGSYC